MAIRDAAAAAQSALDTVQSDTAASRDAAQALLRDESTPDDVRLIATWALGRAYHELGLPRRACDVLAEAKALARSLGDPERESRISTSLALALFEAGDPAESARMIAHAVAIGGPAARAAALNQRAIMLVHRGDLQGGLGAFDEALPLVEEAGEHEVLARLLASRSAVLARLGRLDEAEGDLTRSTAVAERLGMAAIVAGNEHNLGYVKARRGDIPSALEAYDRARASYRRAGSPARAIGVLDTDLAETLLFAGLHDEALKAAFRALEHAEAGGHDVQVGESHLLVSRILMAADRRSDAAGHAGAAADVFRRSARPAWANQADYIALQCSGRRPSRRTIDAMEAIGEALDATGWREEALHLRVLTGQAAISLGDLTRARVALEGASVARNRGTAATRADAWHATALLRLAEGDRRGAKRAARAGLGVVERHRAVLGATDLRARAAIHGADLAALGLRLALEDRRPSEIMRWAERARAGMLTIPGAQPPSDHTLADHLAELRRLERERREAALSGRPTVHAERRIIGLEHQIQAMARTARSDGTAGIGDIDVPRLREKLGDRVLVEFIEVGNELHAVTATTQRCRLHRVSPTREVHDLLGPLGHAHRRLAAGRAAPASLQAFRSTMREMAAALDRTLIGPIAIDRSEIVIVPTGVLHQVPWAVLPTLRGRAITVAPSAMAWARERPAGPPLDRSVALVAGPDLSGGQREVSALSSLYVDATVVTGEEATASATLEACRDATLVHIAAHGVLRADNPLFSSLQMSDGPLTIYELERADVAPDCVVLPACGAAGGEVTIGDEVLGTAWSLVVHGVGSVIAPLLTIADEPTADLMLSLHRRLRDGWSPGRALAAAQAEVFDSGDAIAAAAAASFVTVGVAG